MEKNKIIKRELHTHADLQVREAAEGAEPSRTITGYAILFGVPSAPLWSDEDSEAREVIDAEAISEELLNGCDIKMTMFHDRQLILARSRPNRENTLQFKVDEKGVYFEFDAPKDADGDKALELVRRGDISGCSFMFSTRYYDNGFVQRDVNTVDGFCHILYRVKKIMGVHDFTLAADPAYPDTSCEAEQRELVRDLHSNVPSREQEQSVNQERISEQLREMRRAASTSIC